MRMVNAKKLGSSSLSKICQVVLINKTPGSRLSMHLLSLSKQKKIRVRAEVGLHSRTCSRIKIRNLLGKEERKCRHLAKKRIILLLPRTLLSLLRKKRTNSRNKEHPSSEDKVMMILMTNWINLISTIHSNLIINLETSIMMVWITEMKWEVDKEIKWVTIGKLLVKDL